MDLGRSVNSSRHQRLSELTVCVDVSARSHYLTERGRRDLAPEVKPRSFLGGHELPTFSVDALQPGSYTEGVVSRRVETLQRVERALQKVQRATSEVFLPPASCLSDVHYRGREHDVTIAQAAVRGFLARRHYASLHAKPQVSGAGACSGESYFSRTRQTLRALRSGSSSLAVRRLPCAAEKLPENGEDSCRGACRITN